LNDYPCGSPASLFKWVNTLAVKDAFHVDWNAFFFSGDNGIGFNYEITEPSVLPFY
jgi:hypothetical protein